MKKICLVIALLIIPLKVYSISASSAICMDLDTGRVIYGYNINEKKLIASITKIMTSIIAIEKSDLDMEIMVTDVIYKAYGSAIYVEVGEKIKLKDLLYGLMLRSGNDAALVIAEAVAGSKEEFVYLMNEYANNLKMTNTVFYNPHGLEEENGSANTSSAFDMAILTRYAMQNEIFRTIFKTKDYIAKSSTKTYEWHNKNKLLSIDYVTGGKTGYTDRARRTLVTTASKNNVNLVVVTLNDPNDWNDHKDIYEKMFNEYKSYKILNKNSVNLKEDKYYKNQQLYIKNDYYLSLKKDEIKKVNLNMNYIKLDRFSNDDVVGHIEVILNDKVLHKEPIYIKVNKKEVKLTWLQKLRKWIFK